jgi:hypothetical protein
MFSFLCLKTSREAWRRFSSMQNDERKPFMTSGPISCTMTVSVTLRVFSKYENEPFRCQVQARMILKISAESPCGRNFFKGVKSFLI